MSQNLEELHYLVRQLRTEIEWASRTGIEVALAPSPENLPELPPPAVEGQEDGPRVIEPPIPSPFERAVVVEQHRPDIKPPVKRAQSNPRKPWEAYVGPEDAPPPVGETRAPPDLAPVASRVAEPEARPVPAPPASREAPPVREVPPASREAPPAAREVPATPFAASTGSEPGTSRMPILHTELAACRSLQDIQQVLGPCQRCKLSGQGRTQIVYGVGNPNADIMFVGEGPGEQEDAQGEPFVGPPGQLLTKIIEAGMKLRREDVYIANIVKCRPPKNRDPQPDEVQSCEPFLLSQIRIIQPKVIVALGKYAAHTLLRTDVPISRLRGTWGQYSGIPLMPTFHPADLLRNPAEKRPVWEDILAVMAFVNMSTAPGGAS